MDKKNYPSNSFGDSKDENKPVEGTFPSVDKITKGPVKVRRKGVTSRLADILFSEEAESVGPYILYDIAIPALKNFIVDSINQGLNMVMWGEAPRVGHRGEGRPISRVSYDKVYSSGSSPRRGIASQRSTSSGGGMLVDDFVFESREEADVILATMISIIEDFEVVRVADLYGLVGKTASFTDNRWGWDNLSSAQIVRGREGYYIRLPRAELIKKD